MGNIRVTRNLKRLVDGSRSPANSEWSDVREDIRDNYFDDGPKPGIERIRVRICFRTSLHFLLTFVGA